MKLKPLLLAFAALAVMGASVHTARSADVQTFATANGDVLVLSDAPCTTMKGVFAQVPLDERNPNLKAAKMLWQGAYLDACWAKDPASGQTIVVDETGDAGALEGSPFKPAKS